jgi:hypothetical protein
MVRAFILQFDYALCCTLEPDSEFRSPLLLVPSSAPESPGENDLSFFVFLPIQIAGAQCSLPSDGASLGTWRANFPYFLWRSAVVFS